MKWHIFTRGTIPYSRTFLYHESIRESYSKYFDIDIEMVYLNIGERMYWAWNREQMVYLGKQILEILKYEDKKNKHFNLLKNYANLAILESEKIIDLELEKKSNEELINLANSLFEKIKPLHCYLGVLIDVVDIFPVEYLRNLILNRVNDENNLKIYNDLVNPIYTSYVIEEENEILKIANKFKLGQEIENDLNDLIAKYWWTDIGWENLDLRSRNDFLKVIKEYANEFENPLDKISNNLSEFKLKRENLIKKYNLEDLRYLFDAFDIYTKIHELRKEGQVKSIYAMTKIQNEIARRTGILKEDIEWYSFKESIQFLVGKNFNKSDLILRKKAILEYVNGNNSVMKLGDEAIYFEEKEFNFDLNEVDFIKGVPASFGKVKGIVKICNGAKDAIKKIEKGDILVCGMTLPEYIPAMKKASAIITDEGGITCHAAIVSRELGIPCITGTKIAQKVFKDNDLVEVDANKGLVRKI